MGSGNDLYCPWIFKTHFQVCAFVIQVVLHDRRTLRVFPILEYRTLNAFLTLVLGQSWTGTTEPTHPMRVLHCSRICYIRLPPSNPSDASWQELTTPTTTRHGTSLHIATQVFITHAVPYRVAYAQSLLHAVPYLVYRRPQKLHHTEMLSSSSRTSQVL